MKLYRHKNDQGRLGEIVEAFQFESVEKNFDDIINVLGLHEYDAHPTETEYYISKITQKCQSPHKPVSGDWIVREVDDGYVKLVGNTWFWNTYEAVPDSSDRKTDEPLSKKEVEELLDIMSGKEPQEKTEPKKTNSTMNENTTPPGDLLINITGHLEVSSGCYNIGKIAVEQGEFVITPYVRREGADRHILLPFKSGLDKALDELVRYYQKELQDRIDILARGMRRLL